MTGPRGLIGLTGAQGATGPAGNTGAAGPAGTAGTYIFLTEGVPTINTTPGVVQGDLAIDATSTDFYRFIGGAWVLFVAPV